MFEAAVQLRRHLLIFEAPVLLRQHLLITEATFNNNIQPGWEKKFGRYLIVQISQGQGGPTVLNLREVFATGNPCFIKEVSRSAETTNTILTILTPITTTTTIPGTAHGCLFRDKRDVFGNNLLLGRQFGPSGKTVFGSKIKVKTADDCAKACPLEEECDAFAFSSFQSMIESHKRLCFGQKWGGHEGPWVWGCVCAGVRRSYNERLLSKETRKENFRTGGGRRI